MPPIRYIDRSSGAIEQEQVFGGFFIHLLYGDGMGRRLFGSPLAYLVSRSPCFSRFYGYLQKRPASARKIAPFVAKYQIDAQEFAVPLSSFTSFNDFFTRKLHPSCRPIDPDPKKAVMPADGRYLFFQDIRDTGEFFVKGQSFNLAKLLNSTALAQEYAKGSLVIARLCPTDYHRFHFPCDCTPSETQLIKGQLSSVNPLAIKKYVQIFWENKRALCMLNSQLFGKILFLEIGACFVGTIHQTYTPFQTYHKGDEKGYFSFGGSSLILIFPPDSIHFDADLQEATAKGMEVRCLMGQSMGRIRDIN